MSTKTLRKRIALVAVSALGAGLLTVMGTTSAQAATASASAAGVTLENAGAYCSQGTSTSSSTPRYVAVGSRQVFTIGTTDAMTGYGTITGNGRWVMGNVTADSVDSTGKVLTLGQGAGATRTFEVTGTGAIQVAWTPASTTVSTSSVETHYFISQTTCGTATFDAGMSYAYLTGYNGGGKATTSVDESAGATVAYAAAGQYSYLRVDANDAYGNGVGSSTSSNIASATGGCKLSWTDSDTTGTATIAATGDYDQNNIVIIGDNTPRTCVVTLTIDGTVVANKTVKFTGEVAKITIDKASTKYWAYGVNGITHTVQNENAITYYAYDSANNLINPAATPTFVGLTGGAVQVAVGEGAYASTALTTNGYATLDVNASSVTVRGAATYQLKLTRSSDGVAVLSDVFSVGITKTPHTFTVSFDKSTYQIGDIITLTVSAKDSAGDVVSDNTWMGAGYAVSLGGTTAFQTASSGDRFINGVHTYKFTAGTTAASYGYSVGMTTGSDQAAVTGTIKITDPSSSVTNAEVLAAIVKLIASINKQIAA